MRWLERDIWKAGIAVVGMLLILALMVWVPVSAAGAQKRVLGLATPGTVQATPTQDATVTELNKEKLAQEVQQLKNQNEPDPLGWLRTNASILLSTLVVVIGGLIGLGRWRADRQNELEKRAEERFQAVVAGLGDEKEGVRIGAAILLRTFLRSGYEQFYVQIFDLVVANLRLPRTSEPPDDSDTSLALTSMSLALIVAFKEAFPLARSQNERGPQSLDARSIQLDNAYLIGADLKQVFMPWTSMREAYLSVANLSQANLSQADLRKTDFRNADLRNADLRGANFTEAYLSEADLRKAKLLGANFTEADLRKAKLNGADLRKAKLNGADLSEADLSGANLHRAHLSEANLSGADLSDADLSDADLRNADLSEADLSRANLSRANLSEANLSRANLSRANLSDADLSDADLSDATVVGAILENASHLENTYLCGVKGLTKEQREACKAKGALIDEDTTTSPTQSPVSPSPPSQSNDIQAPSTPPAQVNIPTPDVDRSSTTSSKPDPKS